MKTLILVVVMLTPLISKSQIKVEGVNKKESVLVGRIAPGGIAFMAEMKYVIYDADTVYTLTFKNQHYPNITDLRTITFSGEDNTFNQFYDVCRTVFAEENKKNKDYRVSITLGEKKVLIANNRSMGLTSIWIENDNGYVVLTDKQLAKLFGKN